ncbi:MAG: HAD-IA family hydrolase, partial [Burkholderiales bacterium]
RGLDPLPMEIMRAHASSGARGLIEVGLGPTPGSEGYEALRDRFLELYAENLCVDTRLFAGIPELIETIEARKLPWGIVTNKAQRFTGPLLRTLGLDRRAACVVSGDSTAHIKPHPASLLRAAELLSLPATTCLYVGDDLRDAQAALAAGMRFAAAGWGYLGEGADPNEWGGDAVASAPGEIVNLVT